MNAQVLAALQRYGSPALFVIVTVASIGLPLPVMLLLIVTGSLAAQGVMNLWWAIAIASVGSVLGDQIGYATGRWGGQALTARFTKMFGNADRIQRLDAKAKSWGGAGVFFSRWLVAPLGPWINFASGIAGYSWLRFSLWDVLGETFGAALYIWLGLVFSDRVEQIGAFLGDLSWAILGILAAAFLGWKLLAQRKATAAQQQETGHATEQQRNGRGFRGGG